MNAAKNKSSKPKVVRPKAKKAASAKSPKRPTEVAKAVSPRRRPKRRSSPQVPRGKRLRVPGILLEGDQAGTNSPLGSPSEQSGTHRPKDSLPDAYGSRRLRITPRDPHWVHAHWDFTQDQLRAAGDESESGRLGLRVFEGSARGPLVSESSLLPTVVRSLVHVPEPSRAYVVELGFYDRQRTWSSLAVSSPVQTPPARHSSDTRFEMATLTHDGRLERHPGNVAEPPQALPSELTGDFPLSSLGLPSGEILSSFNLGGVWPEGGSIALSSLGVSSWSSVDVMSSPMAPWSPQQFRFEVNAELVVHGSTEPGATLRLGSRTIPLNPDGTFHLRFALPDGDHDLKLIAQAAHAGETRGADVRVVRRTETRGEVGSAPSEPGLSSPESENL